MWLSDGDVTVARVADLLGLSDLVVLRVSVKNILKHEGTLNDETHSSSPRALLMVGLLSLG